MLQFTFTVTDSSVYADIVLPPEVFLSEITVFEAKGGTE